MSHGRLRIRERSAGRMIGRREDERLHAARLRSAEQAPATLRAPARRSFQTNRPLAANGVLAMQQIHGNARVQRMLAAAPVSVQRQEEMEWWPSSSESAPEPAPVPEPAEEAPEPRTIEQEQPSTVGPIGEGPTEEFPEERIIEEIGEETGQSGAFPEENIPQSAQTGEDTGGRMISDRLALSLAAQCHIAMEGLGTNEKDLFNALSQVQGNPAAVRQLEDTYRMAYGTELVDDLIGDLSGDELDTAMNMLGR